MDALKGYVEANIYNRNHFFLNRFVHYRQKFSAYHFDSLSLQALPARAIEIFAVLGLFILIALAKWTGNNDSAAFLTIGAFMAAAYKIIPGIVKIVNIVGQIKAYELSVVGLNQNPAEKGHNITQAQEPICSVQFRNVSFCYENLPILKNFSFDIESGDFVGITGKSGKGKTTILNLLLGFLTPSSGEILINNNVVNKKTIKKFRPFISYVRQQTFLIYDSIRSNITLEEETSDKKNLQLAIQMAGVDDMELSSSEGMNKVITENGKNISGGQQQRIALARALYNNADLILLDEPFNELDEASEGSLLNHFKQLAEAGKIIVLVTHNKKSLGYCDKIISLDESTS
jgi:ABC-type bacteriocin/lantibiotic exporter with double-glycine peptidase domain